MLAPLSPPQSGPQSVPVAPMHRPDGQLSDLRARVRTIERGAAYGSLRRRAAPLGDPALDAHLPGGGLALGALHEIEGGRAEWDDGAATGFCAGLLARLLAAVSEPGRGQGRGRGSDNKPVLWVGPWRDLYAPGLKAFGLDPGRLIQVRAKAGTETLWAMEEGLRCTRLALWAMEEGLRCTRLAAVVGEIDALERGSGRRLQLAAEASGVTAFALRRGLYPARPGRRGPSAAVTRWRVAAEPLVGRTGQSLERPRWRAELLRCRGAAPGQWCLEWDDAAGSFAVAAALRDRPPALGAGRPDAGADQPRLAG